MKKILKVSHILIITQVFPSGLSGTTVKTRETIQYLLDKGYGVDVCCIHHPSMTTVAFKHPRLQMFIFEKNVLSYFSISYILRAFHLLFSFLPFRIKKMYDSRLEKKMHLLLDSLNYSAILFDGFSTLQYAKKYNNKYIYIDDEDITDLMWQRCQSSTNLLLKIFFFSEWLRCSFYEKKYLRFMNQIWAISTNTKQRLEKLTSAKTTIMPTIVKQQQNVFSSASKQIIFTGLLSWLENREGLKWFLEHHWAFINSKLPDVKLMVTGQMPDQELAIYLSKFPQVNLKGYVPDLAKVYQQSAVSIAPILINSGIKVKVLTYLSYGIPVIALKQTTWGMVELDGVVIGTEENFGQKVVDLLQNAQQRKLLSQAAVKNIYQNHSTLTLDKFFKQVSINV